MLIMFLLLLLFFQQEKPKRIDPLDYETVISELAEDLKEDPLRELLLFPDNDFSVSANIILCIIVYYHTLSAVGQ